MRTYEKLYRGGSCHTPKQITYFRHNGTQAVDDGGLWFTDRSMGSAEANTLAKAPLGTTRGGGVSAETAAEIQRARRNYLIVGTTLMAATCATVAVATVPWLDVGEHGFDGWDAALGLSIAVFKSALVALIFMHLNHEKRLIYYLILLACMHALGFFLGTLMHFGDFVHDFHFYEDGEDKTQAQ